MDNSNSKILLNRAIKILDYADIDISSWAIGGGTVLAHYYNHRLSKDIDIFIDDMQLLNSLSPRFNDISESADDYDEMANYISLAFPEGKVDFIVGSQLTDFKSQKQLFLGHEVYLEDAVEIVAKKMYYRGSAAMARDIFDLAVVYSDRPKDIVDTFSKFPEKTRNFYKAFHNITMEGNALYSTTQAKSILPNGLKYIGKEIEICMSLEKDLIKSAFINFKITTKPSYNATMHTFIEQYNRTLLKKGNTEEAAIKASKAIIKISRCDSAKTMSIMYDLLPQAKIDDTYPIKIIQKVKEDPEISKQLSRRDKSKEQELSL